MLFTQIHLICLVFCQWVFLLNDKCVSFDYCFFLLVILCVIFNFQHILSQQYIYIFFYILYIHVKSVISILSVYLLFTCPHAICNDAYMMYCMSAHQTLCILSCRIRAFNINSYFPHPYVSFTAQRSPICDSRRRVTIPQRPSVQREPAIHTMTDRKKILHFHSKGDVKFLAKVCCHLYGPNLERQKTE